MAHMNFHPSTLGFKYTIENEELKKTFSANKNVPMDQAKPITDSKPQTLLEFHPIPPQDRIQRGKVDSWIKKEPYVDLRRIKQDEREKLKEIHKEEFKVRVKLLNQDLKMKRHSGKR